MTLSQPRDSTIGVVGDGFGSLMVLSAAAYLGFRPGDVTVYGPSTNPVGTYAQYAYNRGLALQRLGRQAEAAPLFRRAADLGFGPARARLAQLNGSR